MEERHVIVSCDQLGETLRAAPTLLEGLTHGQEAHWLSIEKALLD